MESKSFKQFLKMQEKEGNLIKLSQYKRELPVEYDVYNTAYKNAMQRIQHLKDRGAKGYTGFDYMSTEHILQEIKHDNSIPNPELSFEASKDLEASKQRVREGKATSADLAKVSAHYNIH